MRQFDVHRNPSERSRALIPYVVILQSHLLEAAPTVVVAPMLPDDGRSAYTQTSAKVRFDGGDFIVSAAELAAIDARALRTPVGDLRAFEDAVRRAIDRVFTGF